MEEIEVTLHSYTGVPAVLAFSNMDKEEETFNWFMNNDRINGNTVKTTSGSWSHTHKSKRRSLPPQPLVLPYYECDDRISPPAIAPLSAPNAEAPNAVPAEYKTLHAINNTTVMQPIRQSVQKLPLTFK